MQRWTRAQVEGFAPDAKSITAAAKLAHPGPWSDTGCNDALVWGKCQGSGKTPYQVTVDLTGPAVKCSCPSRKFPCKHGVALLLLWVEHEDAIGEVAEAAAFAADWKDGRDARAERSAAPREEKPPDPEAQAKRLAKRIGLMTEGMHDFERWLADLVRQGLAAARSQPYTFWDQAAARLQDAQLPALASRVRDAGGRLHAASDWADPLLYEIGLWYAASRAWQRRDALSDDQLGDLRAFLGWSLASSEVRERPVVGSRWVVEGNHQTLAGRVTEQRTWLRSLGDDRRVVLLDFAGQGDALAPTHVVGSTLDAPLAAYPGAGIARGLFLSEPVSSTDRQGLAAGDDIESAVAAWARELATNPFAMRVPVVVRSTIVVASSGRPLVVDEAGHELPLVAGVNVWPTLARTGGRAHDIFGEVDDDGFLPLTVALETELLPV